MLSEITRGQRAVESSIDDERHHVPDLSWQKRYYLHDIQITCVSNHPTIFALLDDLLGAFPKPARIRGEVSYTIACYDHASHFSAQIPADRKHTETIQLITGSKMRIYVSRDNSKKVYLAYAEQPSMNKVALSVIDAAGHTALTQLEALEQNQSHFLRRCVFLLALGELMRAFQYEPCHAATVTAPWDDRQGALIFGSSGSGKTTMSLGCALSGFGLLGDDLLMLREHTPGEPGNVPGGDIHAYALLSEVSVRAGTLEVWPQLAFLRDAPADFRGKRHCAVENIRPGAFHRDTVVRLLIFPALVEGGKSSVTRLSKAQTLAELVEQCMRIEKTYPQSQGQLFTLLGQLAEQAPGYRLTLPRGAHDGPSILNELFAGGIHG